MEKAVPASYGHGSSMLPRFDTVTAAFYHHVQTSPESVAARDLSSNPPQEITYGELARRGGRLAYRLRSLGVVPGYRVPLVVKRGIDMLVGIVAILTCGAQYVPLDGTVVPDATLQFVVEQSKGKVGLALASTRHRIVKAGITNVVAIDEFESNGQDDMQDVLVDLASSSDGCYVVYTSGTTGKPKGVDVTHGNVTNLLCLSPGDLGIISGTRVGQVLNISFDMAAWEILGCLTNGGTLVIRGSDWNQVLLGIDVLICTPSILAKYQPQQFPNIKLVATAGEASSQRLADTWATNGVYYNCCGPTETTIVNTMHLHQPGKPLSIGTPTPNNIVYILDDEGVQVGMDEVGTMWAGGLGVSRGYVDLPERTAERYQLDPFKKDGSSMYNTGDLCRWNHDGSIEILGRMDDQVKIKGFRVELDGVAASLKSCPFVNSAAVLPINGEIHGFVTPSDCDLEAVTQHVKALQPYYAIPSHFHRLDALPLTQNGKVNRAELQETADRRLSTSTMTDVCVSLPRNTHQGHSRMESWGSTSTHVGSISDAPDMIKEKELNVISAQDCIPEEPIYDLEAALPEKTLSQPLRGLRYRILIVYRRLFSLVGIFNIAAVVALICTGIKREWLGTITAINLATAVLVRQEFVINALYTITCSVPKSWPLGIRTRCAKIYHLGGVHSGAAVSAAAWLLASNIADLICMGGTCSGWGTQSLASKVISWVLSAFFAFMIVLAWPTMRKKYHDSFEKVHRFVGWTMLALFWVQVVLGANDSKPAGTTLGNACLRSPSIWLLAVATASVATSWLFLRRVPVEAEVLSDHAVRLHFDYTVPVNGSFTRISRRPLLEWHSFATIPEPEPVNGRSKGYSLIVSNAGDWTKSCIREPPTHIWTRGVPTCGVMRIATLFNRVVLIATGSGIGPLLGHIQNPTCATQLIWSTSRPESTFGEGLLTTIKSKIPNAVIHDTKKLGRPNLVQMGFNLAKAFNAEAVVIIANEKITKKVVYGLETRGVAAYGAIWDS